MFLKNKQVSLKFKKQSELNYASPKRLRCLSPTRNSPPFNLSSVNKVNYFGAPKKVFSSSKKSSSINPRPVKSKRIGKFTAKNSLSIGHLSTSFAKTKIRSKKMQNATHKWRKSKRAKAPKSKKTKKSRTGSIVKIAHNLTKASEKLTIASGNLTKVSENLGKAMTETRYVLLKHK